MNFIQQAYKGHYEWWRYLVGFFLIVIAWQFIGAIPFFGAIAIKIVSDSGITLSDLNEETMMKVLSSNLTLFLMLLMFAIGLLGIFLVTRYIHKQPIKALTTIREKIDWGRFWFGFLLVTIMILGLTALDYYLSPDNYVLQFKAVPFLIMAVIAIILIPLQTSFEEYLFRGYLMQGIGVLAKNSWAPLIITSVIFGLLHFSNPEVDKLGPIIMFYYIGTGFLFGIMTLMDEGMELALGFHAGNNLIGAMLVTTDWTVFQTNSILKDISEPEGDFIEIVLPLLIFYPIILFIMAKKYGWKNWKEKLTGKIEPEPQVIEE